MHRCEFIANFDTDEMLFPSPKLSTIQGLLNRLEDMERGKGGEEDLPDAYVFHRFFFPDAENLRNRL